jgi:hypothetical protein
MTFGRVRLWHAFPEAFVASRVAQRASYLSANPDAVLPPVVTGAGRLHLIDDPRTRYSFNVNDAGVKSGDVVAYDLAQGKFAQYAVNVRKALAVPATARKRVEGWRY